MIYSQVHRERPFMIQTSLCPHCGSETMVRNGRDDRGSQNYCCMGCDSNRTTTMRLHDFAFRRGFSTLQARVSLQMTGVATRHCSTFVFRRTPASCSCRFTLLPLSLGSPGDLSLPEEAKSPYRKRTKPFNFHRNSEEAKAPVRETMQVGQVLDDRYLGLQQGRMNRTPPVGSIVNIEGINAHERRARIAQTKCGILREKRVSLEVLISGKVTRPAGVKQHGFST